MRRSRVLEGSGEEGVAEGVAARLEPKVDVRLDHDVNETLEFCNEVRGTSAWDL